mgnify:CR=1 FL=1
MNTTDIVNEIQRRYRVSHLKPLSRREIGTVLALMAELVQEEFVDGDGRVWIEGLGALEVEHIDIQTTQVLHPKQGRARRRSPHRVNWKFKPTAELRQQVKRKRMEEQSNGKE